MESLSFIQLLWSVLIEVIMVGSGYASRVQSSLVTNIDILNSTPPNAQRTHSETGSGISDILNSAPRRRASRDGIDDIPALCLEDEFQELPNGNTDASRVCAHVQGCQSCRDDHTLTRVVSNGTKHGCKEGAAHQAMKNDSSSEEDMTGRAKNCVLHEPPPVLISSPAVFDLLQDTGLDPDPPDILADKILVNDPRDARPHRASQHCDVKLFTDEIAAGHHSSEKASPGPNRESQRIVIGTSAAASSTSTKPVLQGERKIESYSDGDLPAIGERHIILSSVPTMDTHANYNGTTNFFEEGATVARYIMEGSHYAVADSDSTGEDQANVGQQVPGPMRGTLLSIEIPVNAVSPANGTSIFNLRVSP